MHCIVKSVFYYSPNRLKKIENLHDYFHHTIFEQAQLDFNLPDD